MNNDLIDRIGAIYAENYIELSKPIRPDVVHLKMRQNNYVTDLTSVVYTEKEIELSWSIIQVWFMLKLY